MKESSKISPDLKELLSATTNIDVNKRNHAREDFLNKVYKPASDHSAGALNVEVSGCIPEILAKVADSNVPDREWYLQQLLRFSIGEPLNMDYYGYDFKQYGKNLEKINKNIYKQIIKDIKPLLGLLKDESAVLRAYTAYFFSFISEESDISYPAIAKAKLVEHNEEVLASFEMALSTLDGYTGKEEAKPSPNDFGGSLISDLCISWRLHKYENILNQQIEFAYASLAKLLGSKNKPTSDIIPWCDGDLVKIAIQSLSGARPSESNRLFLRQSLLPILSRASEDTEWGNEAAVTALYQVFSSCTMIAPPAKGWKAPKDLPTALYELIDQCLEHPSLLTAPVLSALGQNGVPNTVDKLKTFFTK